MNSVAFVARSARQIRALLCAFLCALFLPFGVRASSPLLGAADSDTSPASVRATLYFRYRQSGLLAREERLIAVPRGSGEALAIARALVEGPDSLSPHLSPPFPPGTQVLSTTGEGNTLYVTFNESLMNRYPDEQPLAEEDWLTEEARLRRRLAMAALVNTLSEGGRWAQVQVLVRNESYISTSMRLNSRYYLQEEDSYPSPLSRQEEYIHTPQSTADAFMSAWQQGDFGRALGLVRGSARSTAPDALPSEHELLQSVAAAPRMVQYALTPGVVSLDGRSAVVSVSCRLLDADGGERLVYNHPLHLLLREGIYVIPYEAMLRLLEISDD